ncbi:hypothetical protein [Duganella rhizosphaerae]|uniref:hypothetical protein n=1 Tax=Duganella rhizosphaerae TaxID=2885763 RepID=UPI00403F8896
MELFRNCRVGELVQWMGRWDAILLPLPALAGGVPPGRKALRGHGRISASAAQGRLADAAPRRLNRQK